jgi:hypothetical protein
MDFIDLKTIYVILHIFGAIIGAGGAYMSDLTFMYSAKDYSFSSLEINFLKLGIIMIWFGLGLLIVSGILLFLLSPAEYASSSKFQLKMFIVAVLTLNGFIFHLIHMPVLKRAIGKKLSLEFKSKSPAIYICGAISIVSWTLTIILGILREIPYTFLQGILGYMAVLSAAMVVSEIMRRRYLKKVKNK